MAKHSQYCLGTAETQEKEKKVCSEVVIWSKVCLAITTLMLLCSAGFGKDDWHFFELLKGIMPQNLPQQILQWIVRLSADGNSQWEVARMLGVSQGCISKILRCNQETGWPHQRKYGRWKSPCHGKTVNCYEWSERTTSSRLLVCECRWSTDLRGGCQFEPFGDGFWPPDIGLGFQPDVLGSLWSTGDGGGGTECGTSDNGDTVYLQWWVLVLLIPQWRSGPGAP